MKASTSKAISRSAVATLEVGRWTLPALMNGETAVARATLDWVGSALMMPAISWRKESMTASPFALASMIFRRPCGNRRCHAAYRVKGGREAETRPDLVDEERVSASLRPDLADDKVRALGVPEGAVPALRHVVAVEAIAPI